MFRQTAGGLFSNILSKYLFQSPTRDDANWAFFGIYYRDSGALMANGFSGNSDKSVLRVHSCVVSGHKRLHRLSGGQYDGMFELLSVEK